MLLVTEKQIKLIYEKEIKVTCYLKLCSRMKIQKYTE